MQIFDAIYKKENTLQCKFSDNFIHPSYLGIEFPIGRHLINAITFDILKVEKAYINLIKAYIAYLDDKNDVNFKKYESALFNIDDYCIYLHEITHTLLTSIKKIHPDYSMKDLVDFMDVFDINQKMEFTEQIRKIKKDGYIQLKECRILWNVAAGFFLCKFKSAMDEIKNDIYNICNAPADVKRLDRLTGLDKKRRKHFFEMEYTLHLSEDLGTSHDSKFFISGLSKEGNISYSVSTCTMQQLMYYDLFTALENDIPIKLCKNCNMPFIPKGRVDSLYCDRVMPGFKDRCSAIGALNTYKSKLPDIEAQFLAARKRYTTRVSRNPLLKTEFEVWKIKAKEKLTAYRNGKISADEFKNWFMDDEWMKI